MTHKHRRNIKNALPMTVNNATITPTTTQTPISINRSPRRATISQDATSLQAHTEQFNDKVVRVRQHIHCRMSDFVCKKLSYKIYTEVKERVDAEYMSSQEKYEAENKR